jgi:hypothetical protein
MMLFFGIEKPGFPVFFPSLHFPRVANPRDNHVPIEEKTMDGSNRKSYAGVALVQMCVKLEVIKKIIIENSLRTCAN